jgi:hypothetical protein
MPVAVALLGVQGLVDMFCDAMATAQPGYLDGYAHDWQADVQSDPSSHFYVAR